TRWAAATARPPRRRWAQSRARSWVATWRIATPTPRPSGPRPRCRTARPSRRRSAASWATASGTNMPAASSNRSCAAIRALPFRCACRWRPWTRRSSAATEARRAPTSLRAMTSSTDLRRPGDAALLQHASTHALLLQCAIRVAAEHGIGDASIPRVIAMAQVPAAAFRSHFGTDGELWQTVADGLSNELILIIEATAGDFVDPAKRIACGVRIYLHLARDCPVFAKAVAHRGLDVAGAASLIHNYLPGHIASGKHSARFADAAAETAIDLIAG